MKGKNLIIFILLLKIIAIGYVCYQRYFDFYKSGENDTFKLRVGQSVQIKLYVNGSTGEAICWLNEKNVNILKKTTSLYKPSFYQQLGYEGSGGIISYTFEATAIGQQTIKMAHCPLGPEGKTCEDYSDKETPSDNEFTIIVTE